VSARAPCAARPVTASRYRRAALPGNTLVHFHVPHKPQKGVGAQRATSGARRHRRVVDRGPHCASRSAC
jgi:hypothetical protein